MDVYDDAGSPCHWRVLYLPAECGDTSSLPALAGQMRHYVDRKSSDMEHVLMKIDAKRAVPQTVQTFTERFLEAEFRVFKIF